MFAKRKNIVGQESSEWSGIKPLCTGNTLPLLVSPDQIQSADIVLWAEKNRRLIQQLLLGHGAILLRGFSVDNSELFAALVNAISGEALLSYQFRSTPRKSIAENVYSSTEYPREQSIPLHNEQSYTRFWPTHIYFCCLTPAAKGGETPIADSRAVYQLIPGEIAEEFERKRVCYLRTYGVMDLSCEEVFGSKDKVEIERQCRHYDVRFVWIKPDVLSTSQILPATIKHPQTQENLWFNQAHLFHVYARGNEVAESLIAEFGVGQLPRHARFGDGTEIPDEYLQVINTAYERATASFRWKKGDVLVMDNMLAAHGRNPFQGERKIIVAMTGSNVERKA